jgi:tetratricopeptide (TPR) repeat protein
MCGAEIWSNRVGVRQRRYSEKSKREARFARAAFVLLVLLSALPAEAQVRVWEGVLDLPTYEEGAPDPNPPFDQYATDRFNYPYTLRKEISDVRTDHHWRAIYLENEYLKCSVLPDVGGHIYTCVDKLSGQPMFYANPSIKKARIGYRGAWAAFGVEFNFPVSHNWMSMSPVDFAYAAHEDGSASVTVGNVDRVYGMEWMVELRLRPASTVLEQHVTLSNRSDVRHRFYWWSNAGVQVWDDSRIQYPMRFAAAHGFAEVQRWPVDAQGKDLSLIRNQTDGPVSLFVHGSREEFMGVWNPKTNTGTAHFAEYGQLPAKKIWSWGVDADGLEWRKVLSDNNSAYVELQGGLFRNQETYAFLEPRQAIRFSEYWLPVRETGGISRANLAAVLHLERKNGALRVSMNLNRKVPGGMIQILNGKASLLTDKGNFAPERVWIKEIALPDASAKYTAELRDNENKTLLKQTEGEYNWTPESEIKVGRQNNYEVPEGNRRTEDDWLQQGKAQELNGDNLGAVRTYENALQKFPNDSELLKASGRLDASLLRFDQALRRLGAAHSRNTTDDEVSYYLAIAYEGVGRVDDAAEAYQAAMRLPSYRAAAALRLAELWARRGALQQARESLAESLRAAPDDLRAAEEMVAVLRVLGKASDADKLASETLARFPLSDFLHEETGKPNLSHLAADSYRVLHIATQYAGLGLYRHALEVLSREYPKVPTDQAEPGSVLPQNHPLVVYLRGYCREKLGASGASDYTQAARLSTLYVFPKTFEDYQALQAALRTNDGDATAHYLLGDWYFARAETDAALHEWQEASRLNPQIPALQATIGLALLHSKREFEAALAAFDQGMRNDPTNAVNYDGAVTALTLLGRPSGERVKTLERYPAHDRMPTALVYELALNHTEAGNFEGANALFRHRFFGSEEGGTNVREIWVEVNLQHAMALARAGNCKEALPAVNGLGAQVADVPFTENGLEPYLKSAKSNYLIGEVFSACGQKEEAERRYKLSAQENSPSTALWAWASARKLSAYDDTQWKERLTSALSEAQVHAGAGAREGWCFYYAGALQIALGHNEEAKASLRESLLLPDTRMSHHFSRLALAGATPH